MSTRLPTELAASLQARLRYYRDLGVYDVYRRGEPLAPAELAALLPSVAAPSLQPDAEATPQPAVHANPSVTVTRTEREEPALPPTVPHFMPSDSPVVPAAQRPEALRVLREEIGDCTRCQLAFEGRNKIVFGDGDPSARLMFVGEGPGADEDAQGLPFVGRAGQLLNNMIGAMGLERSQVYIANIVKCRPPQNRVPEQDEANTCTQFLFRQMQIVRPEMIVALGATAATYLLGAKSPLKALRGRIHQAHGSKLIVTYHPAYLLRDPNQKKEAWADLQIAMRELGLKPQKPAPRPTSASGQD
uniref:Type-4 uracil-DNA glycosylase n=1 Tax=Acidobacterium capsulatum TaxID=33075 RepID=A0A7V4XRR4_9BACT